MSNAFFVDENITFVNNERRNWHRYIEQWFWQTMLYSSDINTD
jgi:hypothetical protein